MNKNSIQQKKFNGEVCENCNSQCNCQKGNSVINYTDDRKNFNIPRYKTVNELINYFEDELRAGLENGSISKNDIPSSVNLNHMVFETLVKATMDAYGNKPYYDLNNDEEKKLFESQIIGHFKNISPNNFFKLISDINVKTSSKKVAEDYFTDPKALKALNDFYNEYTDIYNRHSNTELRYSLLYLFEVLSKDGLKNYNCLQNIAKLTKSDERSIRHIACYIINELENESNRMAISDDTKEELYIKINVIDKQINELIAYNYIDLRKLHSIDTLYNLAKTYSKKKASVSA